LAIGAGLLGLLALAIGLAAVIFGPGETVKSEQLALVVLQPEDVPGGRQMTTCSGEPEESVSPSPPFKEGIQVAFLFEGGTSQNADVLCVQSIAALTESRVDAATAMREYQRSILEEARLIEGFSDGRLDVERLDIPRVGERSFAYVWRCTRECEDEDGGAHFIQFQRANVVSVVAMSARERGNPVEQLIGFARKQDDRVVAALHAND
jgi:hypothetical protein